MTEVWMRGPIDHIPSLLQPVAHALLQARNEVNEYLQFFPEHLLWEKPAGVASVGFHLQHLTGVLDRLFTYANQMPLSEIQLQALQDEGKAIRTQADLLNLFNEQVDKAIIALPTFDPDSLPDTRYLGRQRIPTTLIGLLFHAAEHTMRHTGQLYVTTKVLMHR